MEKVKNSNRILSLLLLFNVAFVFFVDPVIVFASYTAPDPDLNVSTTGSGDLTNFFITINSFQYASYTAAIPEHTITENTGEYDQNGDPIIITKIIPTVPAVCSDSVDNPNDVILGSNPASGFCAAMDKCTAPSLTCRQSVAYGYNHKIIDALQSVLDAKIASSNLDKTKANDAMNSCGGDLACINNVLSALQADPAFNNSSTNSSASLSDTINSSSIVNTAKNDPTGLLGKSSAPAVGVTFDSSNITKIGGKMVAVASSGYFNDASDPSKLYFTWYLKKEGCELGGKVNDKCDLDGDGEITVNDWKIEAARIIVAGSFDKASADYSKLNGIGDSDSGYASTPEIDKKKGVMDIGWRNGFLRDGNGKLYDNNGVSDDVANCYVQASKSGSSYELREVSSNFNNECPSGYHFACMSDQTAKCGVFNASDSSYWENFSVCAVDNNSDETCSIKDDAGLKNFKSTVSCNAIGSVPMCVKDDNSNIEVLNSSQEIVGAIAGSTNGMSEVLRNDKMCVAVAKPDFIHSGLFLSNANPLFDLGNEKCSLLQDEIINGKTDSSGNVVISGNVNLEPKCSFEKGNNLCKHLFPVLPKGEVRLKDGRDDSVDMKGAISGDGKFSLAEKKFWGADPSKASTVGNGKDEERVIGLGVDKFEWMYSPGDKVGVVVEGESAYPSIHADSSFKRMWAFSNGACKAIDDLENTNINSSKNTRGFYIDGKVGILTAKVDLNDCLEENLLDPETNNNSKLSIELASEPANPVNDPNGRGDVLNVSTISMNAQNQSGLIYKWTVQKSLDGSTVPTENTIWRDITTDMKEAASFSANDLEGLDREKLAINLNLNESIVKSGMLGSYDGVFYLRIKVKTIGISSSGGQETAEGFIIVKVQQQQNSLTVHDVIADNTGMLTMNTGLERCASDAEKTSCYVTANEIIGLKVSGNGNLSNFSWKVNGENVSCDSAVSSECASGGNKIFIPILGNEGEAIDVIATAVNTKTNDSIQMSRHFVIVKPQVMISSADGTSVWPKLLGYYKDLNENRYPDYSNIVYEAQQGSSAKIMANFYPSSTGTQSGFDWIIDGVTQYDLANQKEVSFVVGKPEGQSYNIGIQARIKQGSDSQVNNLRKALLKNWKVSVENMMDEDQSVNIQINVVTNPRITSTENTQNGFASLISHLSGNLIFLLKIVLTSGGIILLTDIFFSIIPEASFKREEY